MKREIQRRALSRRRTNVTIGIRKVRKGAQKKIHSNYAPVPHQFEFDFKWVNLNTPFFLCWAQVLYLRFE
jgi:hypothetical protein